MWIIQCQVLYIYIFQNEQVHKEIYILLKIILVLMQHSQPMAFFRQLLMFFRVWCSFYIAVNVLMGVFVSFNFMIDSLLGLVCVCIADVP